MYNEDIEECSAVSLLERYPERVASAAGALPLCPRVAPEGIAEQIPVVRDLVSVYAAEELRIPEQCHIDPSRVGPAADRHPVVHLAERFGVRQVADHLDILYLHEPDECRIVPLADAREGAGDVLHLIPIPALGPVIGSLREEVLVVRLRVINGIEEVLHIVGDHSPADHLPGLLSHGGQCGNEGDEKERKTP